MLVLRRVGGAITGVVDLPGFDQSGADTITGTMTAVPLDQPISVPVDQAAIAQRFTVGRPSTVGNPTINWGMVAAPGYKVASGAGPVLISGSVAAGDTSITAMYGNPFLPHDWHSMFTVAATTSRTYTPPFLGLPATLSAGLVQVTDAASGLSGNLVAPLAELININGAPVSSDGAVLTLDPAKAVAVSFVADAQTAIGYQLTLYELVPDPTNTSLIYVPLLGITSTKPDFLMPQELFTSGRAYTFRAQCILEGFPGIGVGDLQMRTLPYSTGYFDSAVFSVAP